DFLGIGAQNRTNIGEQRRQRAGICRARLQALGDDDLMRAVDGDLGIVAGDHGTRARRLDAAVGIGEIALGAIRRAAVGTAIGLAALHHARGWARPFIILRRLLGFGLERRLGGAD